MWNWFNCYLSGRHEFGVWCEPGAIFLRCMHCGKRSNGIAVDSKQPVRPVTAPPPQVLAAAKASNVVPFSRVAVR